jgi:hypothetical protein
MDKSFLELTEKMYCRKFYASKRVLPSTQKKFLWDDGISVDIIQITHAPDNLMAKTIILKIFI